jgi:hypothetical protein
VEKQDEMDEGHKRVIGIMAAILAARKLAQYDGRLRVPPIQCPNLNNRGQNPSRAVNQL